jgi:uncharacterized RmlC-like cupin family protein
MTQMTPLRRVPGAALARVETWSGVAHQEAIAAGTMWSGLAHLAPGAATGWHHHGQYETSLYVASGVVRFEFGHHGAESLEGAPGDSIHVPAGVVRREVNTGSTPATNVITRVGRGPAMVRVEGPET